ncbi:MAG: hypothetical protein N2Z81_02280 [Hydrogenothermaceae bacterium]|nr:hypothetical protein [Hydrogenothermaceae bacterium]
MKKILITLLFSFSFTFAAEVGITKTTVENLPESYGQEFTDFLIKNTDNTELLVETKSYKFVVYPSINWEGKGYTVCFKMYSNNNLYSSSCVTASYADEIYDRLKVILNNEIIKIKNIPSEAVMIAVDVDKIINFDRVKVSSFKGDNLLRYTPILKSAEGSNVINIGSGVVNLNTLLLGEKEAGKLFRLVLENKKVQKILINLK